MIGRRVRGAHGAPTRKGRGDDSPKVKGLSGRLDPAYHVRRVLPSSVSSGS